MTLFEEFMLLKEFEKRENIYANKVDSKFIEKEEMQDKVSLTLPYTFVSWSLYYLLITLNNRKTLSTL